MNFIIRQIIDRVERAPKDMDFLPWLFGKYKDPVLAGKPVILYGTGSLGKDFLMTLKTNGVSPTCFCNSDPSKSGDKYCDLPVISIDKLEDIHKESIVVVATQTHAASVKKLLIDRGFNRDMIIWKSDFDMALSLYFSFTNQANISPIRTRSSQELKDVLLHNEDKVIRAYHLLEDMKSKDIFISKLSLLIANYNLKLFRDFLTSFSEPVSEFGLIPFPVLGPENFFYFNNDVFQLNQDEIYLDVGAFDGDSVTEFVNTCHNRNLNYRHIFAFEPDPKNFKELEANTKQYSKISCHQLGIFSGNGFLRFDSSDKSVAPTASGLNENGDIEIEVISVDKFLEGRKITLLKMDPPGDIMREALIGASDTIKSHKPKLALGAYHSFESIFDVPLLVHDIWPEYKLYLRHFSWTICETDLLAVA